MDPPQCVQNAMMTKDKKPFTYTPGGIDLSEVRSPRMQRRIERNANLGGASDMPQPPPHHHQNVGPLPPAALAAMRPQTQVQVFPGPPPPPPMSKNIPPPPPPPTCPLPTQKVTTGENQVLERPDMTKIIPDNPMALLRKTGGPAPRKSVVDQMFEEQVRQPPAPPQRNLEAQSPRYPPNVVDRPAPVSPPIQQQRQAQTYQQPAQQFQTPSPAQNQYQPVQSAQQQYQPTHAASAQPQYQPPQAQYQPAQVQQRSTESPKPTGYHPPIIERQQTLPRQEQPQKNVSSNVGTLYIPPLQQQQKVPSVPTPPLQEPQVQSPGANLKEAPRPWQQRAQQQDLPPWAKKDEPEQIQPAAQSLPSAPNRQNRWQPQASPALQQVPPQQPTRPQPGQQFSPRSPQAQQQSPRSPPAQNPNSFPVHIEIRTVPYQPEQESGQKNPNAVYITQPLVLQHPGPLVEPPYKGQPKPQQQPQQYQQPYQQPQQYQQPRQALQQTNVDASGARIIPIQIEGRTTPSTPGAERNLSRQLSSGNQPSQSSSFKVIQKMTKTDDEEDDTPLTQHSPRYMQEMPEQVRRMKINDNGHFRQGPPQTNVNRNVPVQAEGNGQQQYVHPSEQVVLEPKKYMGSNIPSRSFKILQAMTAPTDSSANANNNEEIPYNPVFNPYSYPYYPPPYWPDYYTNFYPPEQSEPFGNNDKGSTKGGRSTPLPQNYWHDYYPNNYPQELSDSTSKMSDRSSKGSSKSGRSTPLPTPVPLPPPMPPPFWGYMPPPTLYRPRSATPKPESHLRSQTPKPSGDYSTANVEDTYQYPMYPPYFDPYYYSYYYGYSPMIPPFPYYHPASAETDECGGYSSMDEMSNYNTNRRSSLKRRNSLENSPNSVQSLTQHFEVRSKSATPRITITPTYSQENLNFNIPPDRAKEIEDSNTEIEEEKYATQGSSLCRLRSIKSVQNLNSYVTNEQLENEDTDSNSEESTEEETDEDEEISIERSTEAIIPHQLSIIYEESERGESRRSFRCNSVTSEATTIAEHYSEEETEEDFLANQSVKYKINLFQESSESFAVRTADENSVRIVEKESHSYSKISLAKSQMISRKTTNTSDNMESRMTIEEMESEDSDDCSQKPDEICSIEVDDSDNQLKSVKQVTSEQVLDNNILEVDKQNDDDWWGKIRQEENIIINQNLTDKTTSIKEIECDKVNLKAESVMVEVGEEVVCVKLRNKRGRDCSNLQKRNIKNEEAPVAESRDDLFLSSVPQRDSVYDILKTNEEEEEAETVSAGTLMRVDSFASQLEAIKRNSGLFNFEDNSFNKPTNIIKEETFAIEESETAAENKENLNNTEYKEAIQNKIEENTQETTVDKDQSCEESDEIDFWSQIKNDDDDFTPRRKTFYAHEEENENRSQSPVPTAENAKDDQHFSDSTNSSDSSSSKSQEIEDIHQSSGQTCYQTANETENNEQKDEDSEDGDDTDTSGEEQKYNIEDQTRNNCRNSRSGSVEPQTIKERIEALRNSIAQKQKTVIDKEDVTVSVKTKISAMEVPSESRSKTASTKSSIKSFEEYSEEEELDSGVISDISRHISDSEEYPELRKLTRYERAATHSRLFKLLQDECDIEEEEDEEDVFAKKEDKFSKLSVRQNTRENKLSPSRSKLSLPLRKCNENDEIKHPQINEKLVEELVQSLLKSKKAQGLKNMPKEKLYAAAVTILQEGIDSGETPSEEFSSLLSPLRGGTESSTPAQTPQEFYGDYSEYKQYYDSWSDATVELIPSKAFKLLQEHIVSNKLGSIEGIFAKCPRILSSKNIPKEIQKLLDESGSDLSNTPSQTNPNSNDVTNS